VKYLFSVLVVVVGEGLGLFIFHWLKRLVGRCPVGSSHKGSVPEGMLERLTVLVGLLAGFPQILIAFGALKIGTRLTEEQNDRISNAYFLTGNLLSLLLAMTYAWAIHTMLH
jgi:hypothetical protein